MKRAFFLPLVTALLIAGLAVPVFSQRPGPFTAQIEAALRTFRARANSWPGAQTFVGQVNIVGPCSGCDTGGNAAPPDAPYILKTAYGGLTNAQALAPLASGLMRVTNGTGAITSLALSGSIDDVLRGDGTFGKVDLAGETVAGNQWDIQFNNTPASSLGGNDAFTWNNNTLSFGLGTGLTPAHLVVVNGDLTTPSQTGGTNAAAFVVTAGSSVDGSAGSIDLTGGTQSGTSASGAVLRILGGGTDDSTVGGWVTGVAGAGAVGGTVNLTGGTGVGGTGGGMTLAAGDSDLGGGIATLRGGNGTSANANGGAAGISGGFGSGSGSGGTLDITGGNSVDGPAGSIQLLSGLASGMGAQGNISFISRSNTVLFSGPSYVFLRPPDDFLSFFAIYGSGGVSAAINGGALLLHGGAASSNANGGDLYAAGGAGEGAGNASGFVQLLGGHGNGGATGGDAELIGGSADGSAKAGDAYVTGGVSDTGTNGNIILTVSGNVTINGAPGVTTTGYTKGLLTGTPAIPLAAISAVLSLPACNGGAEGQIRGVSDALLPAPLAVVATGGAVHVPVYCNGTAWIVF